MNMPCPATQAIEVHTGILFHGPPNYTWNYSTPSKTKGATRDYQPPISLFDPSLTTMLLQTSTVFLQEVAGVVRAIICGVQPKRHKIVKRMREEFPPMVCTRGLFPESQEQFASPPLGSSKFPMQGGSNAMVKQMIMGQVELGM